MNEPRERPEIEMSIEEMAEHEHRLLVDVQRMERLNLVKAIKQAIEADDMDDVRELFPELVKVLALFKRNEVTMRVQLKRCIRRNVRLEYITGELSDEEIADLVALTQEARESR